MNKMKNSTAGDVVAIDGKTLRGSYNRHDRQSTIHMVSQLKTTTTAYGTNLTNEVTGRN
jgi:hypothetical protein